MFCISQIDKNMNEKIIKVLHSEKEFLISVYDVLPTGLGIKPSDKLTLADITLKKRFRKGHYLLIGDKQITLVHKFENLIRNGFLKTKTFVVDILFTWKLLSFECNYPNTESDDSNSFVLSDSNSGFDSEGNISDGPKQRIDNVHYDIVFEKCNNSDFEGNISDTQTQIIDSDSRIEIINNEYKDNKTGKCMMFDEFTLDMQPSTMCVIAKRGSGKTWFATNVINNLNVTPNFIENTLIISPTEQMSLFYGPKFPKSQILYNYDGDILTEYLKKIENLGGEEFKNFSGCVVLDDCFGNKQLQKDPVVRELLCNAKHYNLTVVLILQWPVTMPIDLKSSFDYVFLFKDDFLTNQKKLYAQYGRTFPHLKLFKQAFEQLTTDYSCMVIKKPSVITNISDNVFHFKAKSPNGIL